MGITHITVRGARQHNLRNVDVSIPRNTLTVVTGLSGSGKSSLAFDTIYAEGQRRYVETLSAYARQFLDQMERPDVDAIDGLSPAINKKQKTTSRSPRSTVGTITEIYDYLRLLYASVGQPHCPSCGRPITRQSAEQIVEQIASLSPGERITVYAPIVRGRKGEFREELEALDQQGFRARIDGEMVELTEGMRLEKRKNHTIEAVVDRIILKPLPPDNTNAALANAAPKYDTRRLETSVLKALQMANGLVLIAIHGMDETLYSQLHGCPDCGINVPRLEPRSFSFNSNYGACTNCHGLGSIYDFDPAKTITDWSKPLLDGAMGPGSGSAYLLRLIKLFAEKYKINIKQPFEDLTTEQQHLFLYGPPRNEAGRTGFHGIFNYLRANLEDTKSEGYREYMMQYMSASLCPVCKGRRLRPNPGRTVNGASIADFTRPPTRTSPHLRRKYELHRPRPHHRRPPPARDHRRLEFLNAVGSATSPSTAAQPHSPEEKASASASPRKSARVSVASSTSSTNPALASTSGTTSASSTPSKTSATSATPSS
jgi:excinuclease ABC subunit A